MKRTSVVVSLFKERQKRRDQFFVKLARAFREEGTIRNQLCKLNKESGKAQPERRVNIGAMRLGLFAARAMIESRANDLFAAAMRRGVTLVAIKREMKKRKIKVPDRYLSKERISDKVPRQA